MWKMSKRIQQNLAHPYWLSRRTILLLFASCLMLCESAIPWLKDPLGSTSNAWQLPVDIGWGFHISVLNYGLLDLFCALYVFLLALTYLRPFPGSRYIAGRYRTAALLCLLPVFLFFLQYLCADMPAIARLAQRDIQGLLIRSHFGYKSGLQLIRLAPLTLDISTLQGRLLLLLDQGTAGLLLPCICACLLVECRRLDPASARKKIRQGGSKSGWRSYRFWLLSVGLLVLLVVLGRAPASVLCQYQARSLLSSGDYSAALRWLDAAKFLNPSLEQVSFYHREVGQALYFLNPREESADSSTYLAYAYRQQNDVIGSYQQLFQFWRNSQRPSWLTDELDTSLVDIVEGLNPLESRPANQVKNEAASLLWLRLLMQLDPANAYGHYMTGRILYNFQDFTGSITQMNSLIQGNSEADILSSAYTYVALSKAGQGDFAGERILLLHAVTLDPNYYNNTARRELSGLR